MEHSSRIFAPSGLSTKPGTLPTVAIPDTCQPAGSNEHGVSLYIPGKVGGLMRSHIGTTSFLLLASLLAACGDDESGSSGNSSGGASGSTTETSTTTGSQGTGTGGEAQSSGGGTTAGEGGTGAGGQGAGGAPDGSGGAGGGNGGAGGSGTGGGSVEPIEMTLRTRVGDSASNVPFLAFQDGDGPWQAIEGLGGRYDVTRTGERFGVAWVCEVAPYGRTFTTVAVVFATSDDGFPGTLYCDAEDWQPITGTVNGLGPDEDASVYSKGIPGGVSSGAPQLTNSVGPTMLQDIVAVRSQGSQQIDLRIVRNYLPGGNFVVSFASGGIVPEEVTPSVPGAYASTLHTSGGTAAPFGFTSTSLWRLPASQLQDGDMHEFRSANGSAAHRYLSHAGNVVDLPLPESLLTSQVDVVESGPDARFSAAVGYDSAPSGQVLAYHFSGGQFDVNDDASRRWSVYATEAWLDGGNTFETPGLGDLDGWNDLWSLEGGLSVEYYTEAWTSTTDLGPIVRSAGDGNPRYLADEDEGVHLIQLFGAYDIIVP